MAGWRDVAADVQVRRECDRKVHRQKKNDRKWNETHGGKIKTKKEIIERNS